MEQIRRLKRELVYAIISVFFTVIAISSATYAWYAVNNKVKGTTTTISAATNRLQLPKKVHSMVVSRKNWRPPQRDTR